MEKEKKILNMRPKLKVSEADALSWFAVELLLAWATLWFSEVMLGVDGGRDS